MCIVFFAFNTPSHKLIIASNRDEFLHRPTKRAHFWDLDDSILAGIDAVHHDPLLHNQLTQGHGTWIGITKSGRFAFVTNYRENPKTWSLDALSRGFLVRDFLASQINPRQYAEQVARDGSKYNGFNLVVGIVGGECWYISNRSTPHFKQLQNGTFYGLSNGVLDHSHQWPKVVHGTRQFSHVVQTSTSSTDLLEKLKEILQDKTEFNQVPPEMYDEDLERSLSAICIEKGRWQETYATKTHSIILVDNEGNAVYNEIDRFKPIGSDLVHEEDSLLYEFSIST